MTVPMLAEHATTKSQRDRLLFNRVMHERSSFDPHWRELGENILPRRIRFTTSDTNKGDKRNQKIIDSTATFAARTLASGMMSGVTSPARPWFRLTTPDPELAEFGPVKDWLHLVGQRMSAVFVRSNLYNALPTLYGDMGVFGTAAMLVMEDDETVIRCFPFAIGSYGLANDAKLRVRVFVREFPLTVRQLVERFGEVRVSPHIRDLWRRGQTEERFDVCHLIQPNRDHDPKKIDSRFRAFSSCYWEKAAHGDRPNPYQYLEESGFEEWPALTPRWEVTGEDVYGTNCPGMMALGDMKQLQLGEKRGMQAIEKMVNPPLVAPPSARNVSVSGIPGTVSYIAEGQHAQIRPLHEVTPFIDSLEFKQEQVRQRINHAFFTDLFRMIASAPDLSGPQGRRQVTATEILERKEEKLLALGPVLEQLNQDLLDPLIDRTFGIMARRGMIPEAPQELQDVDLRVEYVSVMAQAQKAISLGGLRDLALSVLPMFEAVPEIVDKVDWDQWVDEIGESHGTAPRVIRSDEDVAEMRQARAKQAEMQAEAEMMAKAGPGAKALSEADTSGKNALTDLLAGAVQ